MNPNPDVAIFLDHFGSGGVERVACHVANGLHRSGLRVEMAVLEDSGPVRAVLDPEIAVVRIGHPDIERRGRRTLASVPAIARYLRERKPALLHSPGNHTLGPSALAARLANFRGAFVPKITNPVLSDRMSRRRKAFRRAYSRWALARASAILVLSRAAIAQVEAIAPSLKGRVRVVHNPYVSKDMLAKAAERAPIEPPMILAVGRLKPQKNFGMLLRSVARLRDRSWRLRIFGTGPEHDELVELARTLGIADRVEFAGFTNDLTAEYAKATVLALSSRWEGLPAIVLEAIACGCPIVSTASSPGLVELLDEIGAYPAIGLNDEAGIAEAIGAALDGRLPTVPNSASLPFTIEASVAEHARLFREILGRP